MLEKMIAKRNEIIASDSNLKSQLIHILDRMIINYKENA